MRSSAQAESAGRKKTYHDFFASLEIPNLGCPVVASSDEDSSRPSLACRLLALGVATRLPPLALHDLQTHDAVGVALEHLVLVPSLSPVALDRQALGVDVLPGPGEGAAGTADGSSSGGGGQGEAREANVADAWWWRGCGRSA